MKLWFRREDALDRLAVRVRELETTVEQLSATNKVMRLEWESVYEKYRVAMSKLARREEREPRQDAPQSTNGPKRSPELDRWAVR